MSPRLLSLTALGALSLTLAACGGDSLKDTLGYGKNAPDEFAIVTKAPLVIPPDFSLRPPQPGVARPQEAGFEPSISAQRALMGDASVVGNDVASGTPGEQALLANTGGNEANPRIRQVVNSEMRTLVEKDKTFTQDVLFWQQKPAPDARTVDAAAESRRIEQNEAQGKSVTEGETPSVKPEKPGFFSGLWSSIF
ncbi:MAG: DUF3035 domain-containing protein [Parvibaculum sp.]|uniref:DUF3035 domain-containing protein n=1 Tax=Parvibaculum sp. TaxID=2024848 RepID=UPI0025E7212A|nr:DUF3035 domain-containing protein [Parvibaculum sp.]MCE9650998.1 DUF3035 domain-containing protein [Parvibaculum sp.]